MKFDYSDTFDQGYQAYYRGCDKNDNPYGIAFKTRTHVEEHDAWRAGFEAAKKQDYYDTITWKLA